MAEIALQAQNALYGDRAVTSVKAVWFTPTPPKSTGRWIIIFLPVSKVKSAVIKINRWLCLPALACGSPATLAQTVTELNMGDVYFRYRPAPRIPVQPISHSFIVEGDSDAADNGVSGVLDFERSAALFWAFAQEHRITINLTYADATTDVLKARGYRDSRVLGAGKNSPFYECMRGVTPRVVNPQPAP